MREKILDAFFAGVEASRWNEHWAYSAPTPEQIETRIEKCVRVGTLSYAFIVGRNFGIDQARKVEINTRRSLALQEKFEAQLKKESLLAEFETLVDRVSENAKLMRSAPFNKGLSILIDLVFERTTKAKNGGYGFKLAYEHGATQAAVHQWVCRARKRILDLTENQEMIQFLGSREKVEI